MSLEVAFGHHNATFKNILYYTLIAGTILFLPFDIWPCLRIRFLLFIYILSTTFSLTEDIITRASTAYIWIEFIVAFLVWLALKQMDSPRTSHPEKSIFGSYRKDNLRYQLNKLSEDLERQKHLLRVVIHDVNQPLRAAIFLSQAAYEATTKQKPYFTADQAQALKLSIDNAALLLDSTALLAGILSHEKTPKQEFFRLGHFMESIALQYHPMAEARGLRLVTRSRDEIVCTDSILLSHIIQNLLNNALEATTSGGVILACKRYKKAIYLEVRDTGPGMELPNNVSPNTFETGNKKRPDSEDHNSGLGLQIVYELCKEMKLTFTLRSRLGRGTLARIELPDNVVFRYPRPILVVARNTRDRERLKSSLESWGFSARAFSSSASAIASLHLHNHNAAAILILSQSQRFPNHLQRIILERKNEGLPLAAILLCQKGIRTEINRDLGIAKISISKIPVLRSVLFQLIANEPNQ